MGKRSLRVLSILMYSATMNGLQVVQNNTKEIGVRRVMAATVQNILALMGRDYLTLLFVSIAMAVPIGWWVMSNWLKEFAYRIPLSWWTFVVPGSAVVIIALITVSIHTLKAARTNPATSLKYE